MKPNPFGQDVWVVCVWQGYWTYSLYTNKQEAERQYATALVSYRTVELTHYVKATE